MQSGIHSDSVDSHGGMNDSGDHKQLSVHLLESATAKDLKTSRIFAGVLSLGGRRMLSNIRSEGTMVFQAATAEAHTTFHLG